MRCNKCVCCSGVAFGAVRLGQWLWVGVFIHQILLKCYFSEVAFCSGAMVFVYILASFLGKKETSACDVSLSLKWCFGGKMCLHSHWTQSESVYFGAEGETRRGRELGWMFSISMMLRQSIFLPCFCLSLPITCNLCPGTALH